MNVLLSRVARSVVGGDRVGAEPSGPRGGAPSQDGRRSSVPKSAVVEPLENRALLAAVSWDGGGGDNDWNNPRNWSNDQRPTAADDVTIGAGSGTILHAYGSTSFNKLVSGRPISVTGGQINVGAGGWQHTGTLDLSHVTIEGSGLTVNGQVNLKGTTTLRGDHVIPQGTTLDVAANFYLQGTLENHGTVVNEKGVVLIAEGAQLVNRADGTVRLAASAQGEGVFVNEGKLLRVGSSGTESDVNVRFEQAASGLTQVTIGKIRFDGGGELAGTVDLGNGTTMTLYSHFAHAQTSYQGKGTLVMHAGEQTLEGTVRFNAGASIAQGASTLVVAPGTPASIEGKVALYSNARFDDTFTLPGGSTMSVSSGTVGGAGDFVIAGTLAWDRGTFADGGGATRVAAGGVIDFTGHSLYLQRELEVAGTLNWRGQYVILKPTAASEALVVVREGGTLNASGSSMFGTGTLINRGRIVRPPTPGGNSAATTSVSVPLDNRGHVESQLGTLRFESVTQLTLGTLKGGSWSVQKGGRLALGATVRAIGAGTTVNLSGKTSLMSDLAGLESNEGTLVIAGGQSLALAPKAGTFSNKGVIDVGEGSKLSVTGDFVQSKAQALLKAGVASPRSFGGVAVSGKASLGGKLQVAPAGKFRPKAGVSVKLLAAKKVTGKFKAVQLPPAVSGVEQGVAYEPKKGPKQVLYRCVRR